MLAAERDGMRAATSSSRTARRCRTSRTIEAVERDGQHLGVRRQRAQDGPTRFEDAADAGRIGPALNAATG